MALAPGGVTDVDVGGQFQAVDCHEGHKVCKSVQVDGVMPDAGHDVAQGSAQDKGCPEPQARVQDQELLQGVPVLCADDHQHLLEHLELGGLESRDIAVDVEQHEALTPQQLQLLDKERQRALVPDTQGGQPRAEQHHDVALEAVHAGPEDEARALGIRAHVPGPPEVSDARLPGHLIGLGLDHCHLKTLGGRLIRVCSGRHERPVVVVVEGEKRLVAPVVVLVPRREATGKSDLPLLDRNLAPLGVAALRQHRSPLIDLPCCAREVEGQQPVVEHRLGRAHGNEDHGVERAS
mmetsp:Transcript_97520/g.259032  ORF Transcript_97520/g.259032 Transcript_97520/m.259032 type:complete len:293 (-) Transcript_97520:819-1697(-)